MKIKLSIIIALLLLSACTHVDRSETAEEFFKHCGSASDIELSWYSSNGHFRLSCVLSTDDIEELGV